MYTQHMPINMFMYKHKICSTEYIQEKGHCYAVFHTVTL